MRALLFDLSQSALAFKVARADSESATLSKSKLISFSGPPLAASPVRKDSRLEVVPGSGFGGAGGFGASGLAGPPVDALGFSADHFGGGGLAGLPQANKKLNASSFTPLCNSLLCSLIITTFPVPSQADFNGPIVKHPNHTVNYFNLQNEFINTAKTGVVGPRRTIHTKFRSAIPTLPGSNGRRKA